MKGQHLAAMLLVAVAVLILVDSGTADSHPIDVHPLIRPSTPFLAMKKAAADRIRRIGYEVSEDDNSEQHDDGDDRRRTNIASPLFSGTIRKIIRASYVLNESISGDLDSNLKPTYYRTFDTQTVAKNWFAKRSVIMGAALATHMDSACHVYASPCISITDFNATQYEMTPLVVINITQKVFGGVGNPNYEVSVADLQAWEATHHKRIPNRAFVAMMSGWSNRVYNEVLYFNRDATGQKHFPGFSNAAIDWLLANRPGISGIGVDTSSLDAAINFSFHVHYALLGAGKVGIENLKLTSRDIPLSGAYISNTPVLYDDAPEATVAATIYV